MKAFGIEHICVLMDGNRTYAAMENKNSTDKDLNYLAYYSGAESLQKLMDMTFRKFRIPYLTVNLISRENCIKRRGSARTITKLVPHFFGDIWTNFFIENEVRVKFVGDLRLFYNASEDPEGLMEEIIKIEMRTLKFDKNHLIVMAAYDPLYEYRTLFREFQSEIKLDITDLERYNKERLELVRSYYGFDVPRVNVIIRTWRPKLSAIVPILVGDYADIYLFPAPFQLFNFDAYNMIVKDYNNRISTSDIEDMWNSKDNISIRNYVHKIKITKPVVIGSRAGNSWLPFKVNQNGD